MAIVAWCAVSPQAAASDPLDDGVSNPTEVLADADVHLATERKPRERSYWLALKIATLANMSRLDEADLALKEARGLGIPANTVEAADLDYAEAIIRSNRQENDSALALARRAWDVRCRIFGSETTEAAGAEALMGSILGSMSRLDEAVTRSAHAWAVFRKLAPANDRNRFNAGFQHAVVLAYARQHERSEPLLRELIAGLPRLAPTDPFQAAATNKLGVELLMQGRMIEATPWLRQAVDVGVKLPGLGIGERSDHLSILGIALLSQDRPEEALPFFERSIELFSDAQARPSQAAAMLNAGTAADRSGDRPRGLALREQGMALLASMSEQHPLAVALNSFKLAQSYAHAGRLEEAEAKATEAATAIAKMRPATHFQTTNSAISLGWIKARRGRNAEGLAQSRAAFRLSVETNNRLEVAQNRVVGVLDNIEAYSQTLETAILAGDNDFAFEVLQVLLETDASRAAVAVTAREQAGGGALGDLLRSRQEAATALADADAALTRKLGEQGESSAEQAALAAARADLAAIEVRLDREYPAFRTLLRPRPLTLAETQARLGKDEVLLLVEESDLGIVTMAIGQNRVAIGRAPQRRHDVRKLVRSVRAGITSGVFDISAASRLHDAILTPEVSALIGRKTRLRVMTGDILSTIPLSLLVSHQGKGLTGSRFLIEDHPLTVLPSVTALAGAKGSGAQGGRFIAIGAPALSGKRAAGGAAQVYAGGQSRAANVAELAPLPAAAREMTEIARLLGGKGEDTRIVSGAEATEPVVRALDLNGVGVLLFATHGLVAGAMDGNSEPALVLTPPAGDTAETRADDGLLTASEAAQLRTDAQWVILSACDTAAGDQPTAAGYTGLARAFLFAGAHRVVASHWPVRDDIAARLSAGIVAASRRGELPDAALQKAVLGVMRDRKLADARNPALWAPFMVIGR